MLYLWLQFYYKGYNSGTVKYKRHRGRCVGVQSVHALSSILPTWHINVFIILEVLLASVLPSFHWGFVTEAWLRNHWLRNYMIELCLQPLPFPRDWGVGLKFPIHSSCLVFLLPAPNLRLPRGLTVSYFISVWAKRTFTNNWRHAYHLRNPKDFRCSLPGTPDKDHKYFFS